MSKPFVPDPAYEFIDIALDAFAAMPEGPARDAIQERIEKVTLMCAGEISGEDTGNPGYAYDNVEFDDYGKGMDCTVSYADQDGGEVGYYYSVRAQDTVRY